MIEVQHLSKKFGKKEAVNDVSYSFDTGVYGLLGPNGAGKTTFIRCMLGLYSYKGTVLLQHAEQGSKHCNIGYLPQHSGVFSGLTVEEHLQYFANLKKMDRKDMPEEIDRVLEMVNLSEYKKKKGKKLSGGMVRRLGIAQALLNKPELVVFDEPTTGLDPEERIRFKNIIKKVGSESVVIMSTHIVEDVEAVCDRILIMKEGILAAEGMQAEICAHAKGKVYELPKCEINDAWYVEREFMKDDTEYVRVLTSQKSDVAAVEPTVEDGYLCVLKGI